MSVDTLGLDYAKVNPNGGAIALGHPLGVRLTYGGLQSQGWAKGIEFGRELTKIFVFFRFQATGARQIATALAEAKRSGARVIASSMCIGSGLLKFAFSSSSVQRN